MIDESWLDDNPDYVDDLKNIIDYEKSIEPLEDDKILERHNSENGTDYSKKWENTDVSVHPNRLYQLELNGFLDRVFDSNSKTLYTVTDIESIESIVEEIDAKYDDDTRVVMHEFPTEEELSDMGVFDDVVGYEEVKFLMRRAMSSDNIVNIVLFGPPGSAKTVFLMSIDKLPGSIYISGSPTSGAGFYDEMFEKEPRYMAIDEIDNMDKEHQKALSDYTSEGILVETKGNNKKRRMRTNTHTFAAANRPEDILPEIEDRFIDIHFDPYTRDEFIEVCEHILPKNEGKSKEESKMIGEAVWELEGRGDVRKAIQTARLSDGDPERILGVLDEYSSKSIAGL